MRPLTSALAVKLVIRDVTEPSWLDEPLRCRIPQLQSLSSPTANHRSRVRGFWFLSMTRVRISLNITSGCKKASE